jgi:PAS domain S-box-containing protein
MAGIGFKPQPVELRDFCRPFADGSPAPMAAVEGGSHIIRYVNPAFCLLLGQLPETLTGALFSSTARAGDECLQLLERVDRAGQAETHTGREHLVANRFYWSYSMWPILTADNSRVGILIMVTETTPFHERATAINEALMIGSVRQHEAIESAEMLNGQLQAEIVRRNEAEREMEARQREIEASEQRHRGLIEAIPHIVWTARPDGTLCSANSKWFEYFGFDPGGTSERAMSALLHPDDRDRCLELWAQGLASESSFEMEHRLRNMSTGVFRWHLSRAAPIRGENGRVTEWLGTSTDVDDQKRAELAVYHKKKMESLGVLAGGIAHDFNNLLVGVVSGASYAASAIPAAHPVQEILNGIVRSGQRAAELTRQMLAYAGKGRYVIEQIDPGELVASTCDLIRTSLATHVRLIVSARANLPLVDADPSQMQQLVMNLVLNAAESMDEATAGSVIVKVDFIELDTDAIGKADFATGSLVPGRYVVLQVQDTGSGMDEGTKAKVFDPFFTTKFPGRGLGLAAVEGILRSHNAALKLESSLGRGSTFRVYLPVSPTLNREGKGTGERRFAQGAGTVLMVDDDEVVRQVAALGLQNGGFTVRLAAGGHEAIRMLGDDAAGEISVVVLDFAMPGMSGKEVMQRMTEMGIHVPVLITSGFGATEVCEELTRFDIAGFIQKPFTGVQLASCVSTALRR